MSATLPETAAVHWRPRMDAGRLSLIGWSWTASTLVQVLPMLALAIILVLLDPVTIAVGAIMLVHAWVIPELYANRGAKVIKPKAPSGDAAEATALGLLGDLVDHRARELHARTGLIMERGALGVWLVGEAGALLVRGRRVHCWCVRATDPDLPSSDRIAHLLLALRADEQGFATVANHAFAGARWRVRRRLPKRVRPALDAVRHSG
ncbi:hypothetical protein [Solirubrobacter soli]|uniref:hypothetical protein n=1 Tax=Solirubrobacter soli TaxID=363832 RepID=UPI000402DAA4|nr:hypothetical protein [Solirubrobacter soli]